MNTQTNTSNKLPRHLDNPIDLWICDIGNQLDPLFVQMNMTPNKLTTISGIFGLLTVYCLQKKIKYIPGILFFIAYMFDCFDGLYARKHNMTSKFGAYYDVIKDLTVMGLVSYVLYKRHKMYALYFTLVLYMCGPHLGCQEHHYRINNPGKMHSDLLSLCTLMCPFKDVDHIMQYTRYTGTGTANLLASIILFFV